MANVVVVTSGKGGVGKTTSTAALGAALARTGKNVVVVDFDVGLRNLDLVMGAERRVVFDLINVVQGHAKLTQALIRDKRLDTLYLLPASQTRDKDALTEEGVAGVIAELRTRFDWVICDSPAGIERGANPYPGGAECRRRPAPALTHNNSTRLPRANQYGSCLGPGESWRRATSASPVSRRSAREPSFSAPLDHR